MKQAFDMCPAKCMTLSQSNEHLRNYTVAAYEANRTKHFDPTREKLNFEIAPGGIIVPVNKTKSIPQRIKERLDALGINDPNDGLSAQDLAEKRVGRRIMANIIIGDSRKQMLKMAFGEQNVDLDYGADNSHIKREKEIELWATDMFKFMSSKFGEQNIMAFVVHLDEKNPYVHCTLLPISDKGKLSWAAVFGRQKMKGTKFIKQIHDEIAKVNAKWNLERGNDIRITGVRHRSSKEYWQWLKKECHRLEKIRDEYLNIMDEIKMLAQMDFSDIHEVYTKATAIKTKLQNIETLH